MMKLTGHDEIAGALFLSGYNCAQSVLCAFADVTGFGDQEAIHIAAGLGGGVARMREICGTISAMAIVMGCVYGSDQPQDHAAKAALYAHVQAAAAQFKEKAGSMICRELLGSLDDGRNQPEERSEAYYHRRPCKRFVELAAATLEQYLAEHPPQKTGEEA